jgi:hypothetical protein
MSQSTSNEYNITDVPLPLRSKIVRTTISYEFLDSGAVVSTGVAAHDEKQKNHLVVKFTFEDPGNGPIGVRIAMDTHHDSVGSNEAVYSRSTGSAEDAMAEVNGELHVKEFDYREPSIRAIRSFQFSLLKNDLTLGTILNLILKLKMEEFKFGVVGLAWMGCRDWQ